MKKFCLFFISLFSFLSLMFLPTFAKYQSTLYGDIFNISFSKPTVFFGVYIKNIEEVEDNKNINVSYTLPTNVTTTANVANSSVTYKVTVHNNTDVTYWYIDQYYDNKELNNNLIENGITVVTKDKLNDTSKTFNNDDWVPPQTERDFYVTYTIGSGVTGNTITDINFKFDIRMDSVYDGFLAVLNDKTSNQGYNYLSNVFDEKYAKDGTTVIGNIGEDEEIFNNIFGGDLTINIDGQEVPVTVLVERKNVDKTTEGDAYKPTGPSGCEYTVYITVDDLSSPTGKATVYAISYSCDKDGNWFQLGQLYEGTANKEDYNTKDDKYEGSFDVDSWIASKETYTVVSFNNGSGQKNISYNVGMSQGDQYDMLKTLEELMSCKDQDIYNDIDNTGILVYVYKTLQNHNGSSHPAIVQLRTAFENMAPYYNVYNNGQEIKIKRDGNTTRSRLIPHLIELQEALDYYYQTVELKL